MTAAAGSGWIEAEVEGLAAELRARDVGTPLLAFVLGSGLGAFAEALEEATTIPGEELRHLPRSAVPGHAGRIVVGELAGVRVLAQVGRVHLYEGWDVHAVSRAVRAFARLGVRGVVLTNAAGGLRRDWPPGTLMRIRDHLNLQGRAPLQARAGARGRLYDPSLGEGLERAAERAGIPLRSGVYAGLLGPAYETPAEIEMLAWMGADAVGMSTVAEGSAARMAGMRVAGVSCITNPAAGIAVERLSHADVVAAADALAPRFSRLLVEAVPLLAATVA